MNKLLKILFVLLLTLTVIEVGYYIYSIKVNKNVQSGRDDITMQPASSTPQTVPGLYVDADICSQYQTYKVHRGEKVRMLVEQEGRLDEISLDYPLKNGTNLALRFSILNNFDEKLNTYGYAKNEIGGNIKLYKLDNNGNKVAADLKELKNGQKVKYIEYSDIKTYTSDQFQGMGNELILLD